MESRTEQRILVVKKLEAGGTCPGCGAVLTRQKDDREWMDEAEFMDWMEEA